MELELEILERTSTRKGEPSIHLARKTGVISISHEFAEAANLYPGNAVAMAVDPKREKDWYLIVFKNDNDPKGIPVRAKVNTKGLMFNSSSWAQRFIDQFGKEEQPSIRVALGKGATEILDGRAKAYPILTKTLE